MNLDELTGVIAEALGKDRQTIEDPTQQWDSLDRLEIITHLHDVFGDRAAQLDSLNSFTNLDTLAIALRADGLLV